MKYSILKSIENKQQIPELEEAEPKDSLSFDDIENEYANIEMTQRALQSILDSLEADKIDLLDHVVSNRSSLDIPEEILKEEVIHTYSPERKYRHPYYINTIEMRSLWMAIK